MFDYGVRFHALVREARTRGSLVLTDRSISSILPVRDFTLLWLEFDNKTPNLKG